MRLILPVILFKGVVTVVGVSLRWISSRDVASFRGWFDSQGFPRVRSEVPSVPSDTAMVVIFIWWVEEVTVILIRWIDIQNSQWVGLENKRFFWVIMVDLIVVRRYCVVYLASLQWWAMNRCVLRWKERRQWLQDPIGYEMFDHLVLFIGLFQRSSVSYMFIFFHNLWDLVKNFPVNISYQNGNWIRFEEFNSVGNRSDVSRLVVEGSPIETQRGVADYKLVAYKIESRFNVFTYLIKPSEFQSIESPFLGLSLRFRLVLLRVFISWACYILVFIELGRVMSQSGLVIKGSHGNNINKTLKLKIKVPCFDNSALIEGYSKSLIGRYMNPAMQDMTSLLHSVMSRACCKCNMGNDSHIHDGDLVWIIKVDSRFGERNEISINSGIE
ncbi:unnamed protein product [Arabidopsis arenosa]|uniref:Uncharacterized protein n=1 Tax=Arabidopsis arenosa TaxID=38785 RepID=A0A8S2A470_ARAAE|nr:unnamed protein product [Arabidopsis arenosa]